MSVQTKYSFTFPLRLLYPINFSLENSNYKGNFTFNIASPYQFVCIICGFPYSPNVIFIIYIFFILSNLFIFAGFPVIRLCVCPLHHHPTTAQTSGPQTQQTNPSQILQMKNLHLSRAFPYLMKCDRSELNLIWCQDFILRYLCWPK